MKIFIPTFFLLAVCFAEIRGHVGEKHDPDFLDKIKEKTNEIVDKIRDGGEIAVQKIKSGYQASRCKLHQVGEKIYAHKHKHDPCDYGDDVGTTTITLDKPGNYEDVVTILEQFNKKIETGEEAGRRLDTETIEGAGKRLDTETIEGAGKRLDTENGEDAGRRLVGKLQDENKLVNKPKIDVRADV